MSKKVNIFWFRRDLRLKDNAGLYRALKKGEPVLPIFIRIRIIVKCFLLSWASRRHGLDDSSAMAYSCS